MFLTTVATNYNHSELETAVLGRSRMQQVFNCFISAAAVSETNDANSQERRWFHVVA
ncbi:hypothetical protein DY000_02020757 [Brassica cretica]|uniref:Uncharacterized protein n=1 Tax=Brassica cretica TaxID=69181 RepID=A0ABQ7EJZ5_BRACR|nr:hypothetical protein DY000_02020757 [Brassica cretica]